MPRAADGDQIEDLLQVALGEGEIAGDDPLRGRVGPIATARERPVIEPLSHPPGHRPPQTERVETERTVEPAALGRDEPQVAGRPGDPAQLDLVEDPGAERAQLRRCELDVVIGVDDLVGPARR